MSTLTPEGQRLVDDLVQRHGFSEEAVARMLAAVIAGQGQMAQFQHVEFGGSGQWMSGGMLMLGDMFNQGLKSRVDALCTDLSSALASCGPLAVPAPSQSQNQSQGGQSGPGGVTDDTLACLPDTPFFTTSPGTAWWPQELGSPSSTGSQNAMRYAWFANARRLVTERDGEVTVYDTLDHQIGGFSQQQGSVDGLSMSSQHGAIDLTRLPVVSDSSERESQHSSVRQPTRVAAELPIVEAAAEHEQAFSTPQHSPGQATSSTVPAATTDPIQMIKRLGELRDHGLLSDEEFSAKKTELLSRL